MLHQKLLKTRLKALQNKVENKVCCDCKDPRPTWASIIVPPPGSPEDAQPIGAFCCYMCSGIHRSLGVHICFVRSIDLDDWTEDQLQAMQNGGNNKINAIFEATLGEMGEGIKPQLGAEITDRERYVKDKYLHRKYLDATMLETNFQVEGCRMDEVSFSDLIIGRPSSFGDDKSRYNLRDAGESTIGLEEFQLLNDVNNEIFEMDKQRPVSVTHSDRPRRRSSGSKLQLLKDANKKFFETDRQKHVSATHSDRPRRRSSGSKVQLLNDVNNDRPRQRSSGCKAKRMISTPQSVHSRKGDENAYSKRQASIKRQISAPSQNAAPNSRDFNVGMLPLNKGAKSPTVSKRHSMEHVNPSTEERMSKRNSMDSVKELSRSPRTFPKKSLLDNTNNSKQLRQSEHKNGRNRSRSRSRRKNLVAKEDFDCVDGKLGAITVRVTTNPILYSSDDELGLKKVYDYNLKGSIDQKIHKKTKIHRASSFGNYLTRKENMDVPVDKPVSLDDFLARVTRPKQRKFTKQKLHRSVSSGELELHKMMRSDTLEEAIDTIQKKFTRSNNLMNLAYDPSPGNGMDPAMV